MRIKLVLLKRIAIRIKLMYYLHRNMETIPVLTQCNPENHDLDVDLQLIV